MLRPSRAIVALFALTVPTTSFAAASPQAFKGEYTVSFLGLSIARATFSSRYEGDAYAIDGTVSAAGLGRLFDDTKGTISSKGTISGQQMQPRAFRADYTSGKKASVVDIRFANGGVASTEVIPPPKKRDPKSWVPVGDGDLKSVLDPMAATVIHADSLDKVCGRTVKFYDGEMRANLSLTYASKGSISVPGYKGDTVTCRMGFEPVAGYRKGRKALEFLKNKSRMMVTFAPLGQSGVYAPIRATVGTQIGPLTISARRFEAVE
ncbi:MULTISPECIES: DUF3108 domain-containing protein [unclassified Mesorhizobium]|uniref:DUF3108 domain-containing protein n=1 Tax=unclassified Mesorhizobium TaxID=325217 RepID=UPI000F75B914|nr:MULTISPECIES: DUF3108 domain-containing protein [unclassified Mesorhizobium]AZO21465.1 DUF3108 domain-containing protein [Mesorhizobium sp. M1E.F.Ca.ET.045.02.1.1]RUW21654.1 DUF3108 domain-containing protein [Mesorhizobium sp. M1E.F.Ca.ET.041.01.1.1]RUW81847.1 DUF3108 domain-containing protein [Mesorhizobium sp. M1E.F.Ca.ET.063.01.1.1]RWB58125.1 MAG: DUF3108 domain-containing protein [Mesorhizobium sp.]RWD91289.1 MAG: DUF3108 domain-containing protein [Mesorhizobium sp.]